MEIDPASMLLFTSSYGDPITIIPSSEMAKLFLYRLSPAASDAKLRENDHREYIYLISHLEDNCRNFKKMNGELQQEKDKQISEFTQMKSNRAEKETQLLNHVNDILLAQDIFKDDASKLEEKLNKRKNICNKNLTELSSSYKNTKNALKQAKMESSSVVQTTKA